MDYLLRGLHEFQDHLLGERQALFERLADGQNPEALSITCSDSRIGPNLVMQADAGELFVLRNISAPILP